MRFHLRTIEKSPTHVVEEPMATDAGSARPDPAAVAPDRDDQGERLDAVAGSEFVDDRIRED